MKTGKWWGRSIGSCLIGIGGAALVTWAWVSRERLLLEQASRVADLHKYALTVSLSDQEVLTMREVQNKWHYFRRNLTTEAEQPLPILDRLIKPGRHTQLMISPDGQWLLWNGGEESSITQVIRLDGKRHYQLDAFWNNFNMCWMADSRHWVEFTGRHYLVTGGSDGMTRAIVHDVDHPKADVELTIPPALGIMGGDFTRSGHLLVEQFFWDQTSISKWPISEFQFLPKVKLLRKWTVRLPRISNVKEVQFSPEGDRIAWQFQMVQSPAYLSWLRRFMPFIKDTPQVREELWVSDSNGDHWHELGYLPLTPADDPEGSASYLDVQWLPGSQKLSFEYNDFFYTVPAN